MSFEFFISLIRRRREHTAYDYIARVVSDVKCGPEQDIAARRTTISDFEAIQESPPPLIGGEDDVEQENADTNDD